MKKKLLLFLLVLNFISNAHADFDSDLIIQIEKLVSVENSPPNEKPFKHRKKFEFLQKDFFKHIKEFLKNKYFNVTDETTSEFNVKLQIDYSITLDDFIIALKYLDLFKGELELESRIQFNEENIYSLYGMSLMYVIKFHNDTYEDNINLSFSQFFNMSLKEWNKLEDLFLSVINNKFLELEKELSLNESFRDEYLIEIAKLIEIEKLKNNPTELHFIDSRILYFFEDREKLSVDYKTKKRKREKEKKNINK